MGVQLAINVNSKYQLSYQGNSITGELSDLNQKVREGDLDFSIPVGLSYEFYGVVVDARYNFSTTKFIDDVATRHSVFQFTIGYKLCIIKGNLSAWGINVNTFDFSIPIGLRFEFSNVVIDARYNIGITKIEKDGKERNSVFQFTLGYKFKLK